MRMTRTRMWIIGLSLLGAGLATGMVRGWDGDEDNGSEIQRGLDIAPLRLNLRGKNRALVGLGSYIVNAQAGCNDCHSKSEFAAGGSPFLGQPKVIDTGAYLRGGQAFGPFISRNIRPELPSGLPAGLTYAQFLRVMQHGTDFDNPGQLLQVMPWPTFQDMTERDLAAIYEYLSALPPATPNPPAQ